MRFDELEHGRVVMSTAVAVVADAFLTAVADTGVRAVTVRELLGARSG